MTSHVALQPALHDLVSCISAPSLTMSDRDGAIGGDGVTGFFLGERRLLSRYRFEIFGRPLETIRSALGADGVLRITAIARDGTEDTPDPTLLVRLDRQQHGSGFADIVTMTNQSLRPRSVTVALHLACDLAPTSVLKAGLPPPPPLTSTRTADGVRFEEDGYLVEVAAQPRPPATEARRGPRAGSIKSPPVGEMAPKLEWNLEIASGGVRQLAIVVSSTQPIDDAFRPLPPSHYPWSVPTVETTNDALRQLVEWSFGDLRRLALADPSDRNDTFIAAGCPWYLTLFGRDSLWTARMMMPFGTGLAAGTLRALARRQGIGHNRASAEQPGRIPHELRPVALHDGSLNLPPVYYGSVDATPLWITTLVEAWRWGLDANQVEPLLSPLQAAVDWMLQEADADGDGLCEYVDFNGTGLSNQGWKDSGDSVNWHDGTLAAAPIALVEVQGYAYEAARNAQQIYEHFGISGTDRLRHFADRLHAAFHETFWVHDERGPRLAIALDSSKRAVDSNTSNPGHVLGTGLLSTEQEAMVVRRLMNDLDTGVGLRTMSTRNARYNPLSYHNGSIWPHDSAICARGMILAGHPEPAGNVLAGLLAAAKAFDGRLPELFGFIDDEAIVVPYPASCRPQAWAAAVGAVATWAAAPMVATHPLVAPNYLQGVREFGDIAIRGFECHGRRVDAAAVGGEVHVSWPDGNPHLSP